ITTCPLISFIIQTTILGTPMRENSKSTHNIRHSRFHLFFLNTPKHNLYLCPLAGSTFKDQLCPMYPCQFICKGKSESDPPCFFTAGFVHHVEGLGYFLEFVGRDTPAMVFYGNAIALCRELNGIPGI